MCQTCSSAETLHTAQGRNLAHRTGNVKKRAKNRKNVWRLRTWNVRVMVDAEGPVEVASRGTVRGEERKVGLVVRELAWYDSRNGCSARYQVV